MGYIDCDGHVREPESTWDYLDPGERHYRPEKNANGLWVVDGIPTMKPFDASEMPAKYNELYPVGSVDLSDLSILLKRLDELGVDVQVLFPSLWLHLDVPSPDVEAALMRSWNRWIADRAADGRGRLLWTVEVPFRLPERAIAEMEFGKKHGAGGIHLAGLRHGVTLADPLYRPIYEKAQELDLVIAVHTGGDRRKTFNNKPIVFNEVLCPVAGALYALYTAQVPAKYPSLRWTFVEAGATWLPFVVQEASRSDEWGRTGKDWFDLARTILADHNFYVGCQIDDDLPYLVRLFGETNIVHGTDYSHMDRGSDAYGLNIIATRPDLETEAARAIVDSNGRRLWGVDPSFTPAPIPELRRDIVEASPGWIRT